MANNVAPDLPVRNSMLFWCRVVKKDVNVTTGDIEESPHTGQTVRLFIADQEELEGAATIDAAVEIAALTEVPTLGIYWGVISGDDLLSGLHPTYIDQAVFVHFVIDTDKEWHEVAQTTPRDRRTGA